jgi:hypothetical protein
MTLRNSDPGSFGADELALLSTGKLLALSRLILAELRHREVIRSGNAPAGDYAELLVRVATSSPQPRRRAGTCRLPTASGCR